MKPKDNTIQRAFTKVHIHNAKLRVMNGEKDLSGIGVCKEEKLSEDELTIVTMHYMHI